MDNRILLYHTGYQQIQNPDVHFGRTNADFGQGFYTTKDPEFAKRWARERKGSDTIINTYELDLSGLDVLCLQRDDTWFTYIYHNRSGRPDAFPQKDVIIGPIANDTIFDTFGIVTSGILSPEQSLKLLQIGPVYEQVVLKTRKAAAHLHWISSTALDHASLLSYQDTVHMEERSYQSAFARCLEDLSS